MRHGVARGDRATEQVADQHRGGVTGRIDQLVDPPHQPVGVELPVDLQRPAVARQVDGEDAVGGDQVVQHVEPHRPDLALAVEQDHRWPLTTLEDRGADPGELLPSLGQGCGGQQPVVDLLRVGGMAGRGGHRRSCLWQLRRVLLRPGAGRFGRTTHPGAPIGHG